MPQENKFKFYIIKKIFTILGLSVAFFSNAQIVINEVYGGGGNSGSTYTHDFIELYNAGTSPVTLNGLYLWYGSAAGAMGGSAGDLVQALPAFTLQPGAYYLVQQAPGAGGTTALPTPDYVPTNPFNMGATNLKVALTNSNVAPTSATSANVVDFVGTGTANMSEGSSAPVGSNSASVTRTNGIDTNNNSADFTVSATPTPTNSNNNVLGVSDITSVKSNFVKNTLVNDEIKFGSKADVKVYNMNGQVVKTASVSENKNLDAADLAPGMYIVTGTVNGEAVSQKILKK